MNERRRILLIAATTGYQTSVFAEAGARLGFDIVMATDRCHVLDDPWGDRAIPLRFEDPAGAAAALAELGPFDGVVAVGDRPASIAAVAATRLGLQYNPVDAVAACLNKYLARGHFRDAGLLVPWCCRVPIAEGPALAAAQAPYPCVLKPLGLSASRGVIRANNPAEFRQAFQRIATLLQQPDIARMREEQDSYVQVEEFIPGREFALEGILIDGRFRPLALFDKPDPLDGPFFEETIYITPSRETPSEQRAIVETTERAIRSLGLLHGPIHAEMRVNERGVWMLEIAARPIGGLCSKVLPGLEDLILRHAAGEDVSGVTMPPDAAGVMMIPIPREGIYTGVAGVDAARETPLIEDVIITAKEGQRLLPLPEGNSYLGFIFARGDTPQNVEHALRAAHEKLSFDLATVLPVI